MVGSKGKMGYLLSFVKMVMKVRSSVEHGCLVLVILLQADGCVQELDI
jgi:hypothetical protein